jgi:preprotein translocase subunit SecD
MIIVYRLPGLLASVALVVYVAITLAIFKLVPITLTLAGIGGFILSIGMAVDANILIFARMKEEIRQGKELSVAIGEGFKRAWPSIRDSNLNSLIVCAILFLFSTSFIKGFALTLSLGIVVSLFSAIFITRILLLVFVGKWAEKVKWIL